MRSLGHGTVTELEALEPNKRCAHKGSRALCWCHFGETRSFANAMPMANGRMVGRVLLCAGCRGSNRYDYYKGRTWVIVAVQG